MFSPTVAYFVPVTVSAGVGSLTSLTLPVVALAFLVALAAGARAGIGQASAGPLLAHRGQARGARSRGNAGDGSRIGDLGVFGAPDTRGDADRGQADQRRRNGNACYARRK